MRKLCLVAVLLAGAGLTLAEDKTKDDFKRERNGRNDAGKDALEGKAPPALEVKNWVNTGDKAIKLSDYKGKVVVLDFWGVWCGPCVAAMPKLKTLLSQHKDDGLVIIGIHTTNQGERMANFVKEKELPWPTAVDDGGKTVKAFAVDSFPDYYIIDRSGKLRVADLANGELERVVKILLKEPAPK